VDQLYLAVRLAICELALPGEDPAPLVLDDALASFDNRRMALALELLHGAVENPPDLLFTCQPAGGRVFERPRGRDHLDLQSYPIEYINPHVIAGFLG
jgi:uncharacterized protein YhaN